MTTIKPTLDNVKNLGRTCPMEDGMRLIMSASGIEFRFTGNNLSFLLEGDEAAETPENTDNYARYAIYVNDELVAKEQLTAKVKTATVLKNASAKNCVIRFLKISEAPMSSILITGIETDDDACIEPTAPKKCKIEIIGDSITCGYSIEDEDPLHHFSTSTEDVTEAYAYRTIRALDADYAIVSYSGYGIVSGYTGDGVINKGEILPDWYDTMGRCYAYTQAADIPWDFSRFTPDIVVMNLGTNDDSYCLEFAERRAEHRMLYIEFLKHLRSKYKDAKLVCILGLMGDRLYENICLAAKEYTAETGDTNIYTYRITPQLPEDGLVADYHPTVVSNKKAAEGLTAFLKSII